MENGYRFAPVYNLVLHATRPLAVLKDPSAITTDLQNVLSTWGSSAELPDRQVWMLDHQYSQDGLKDITSFKNRDRAVGTILHGLVTAGDLHAYLATLTKTDEADENMEYVDSNITVNHVTTLDGSAVGLPFASSRAYSARHLHMTDILQGEEHFEKLIADEDECAEATGNEGVKRTRTYHQAAVILWPADKHAASICRCGGAVVLDALLQLHHETGQIGCKPLWKLQTRQLTLQLGISWCQSGGAKRNRWHWL